MLWPWLQKKWAHITSLWICILLVFCCYCLFWFWVLGSCNWGWPWTLRKTKDDLEFPILLLLPPEWILRLRVYSQPARFDFFLLLLFACFIGTGDIKLSYPPLQSPKGLWNKTSDCLQVSGKEASILSSALLPSSEGSWPLTAVCQGVTETVTGVCLERFRFLEFWKKFGRSRGSIWTRFEMLDVVSLGA